MRLSSDLSEDTAHGRLVLQNVQTVYLAPCVESKGEKEPHIVSAHATLLLIKSRSICVEFDGHDVAPMYLNLISIYYKPLSKVKGQTSILWITGEMWYLWMRWTLTKVTSDKLEAFEMWLYRRMLRISWKEHKTNGEVLHKINKYQKIIIKYYQNKEMSIFWTYNKRRWGTTIADGRQDKW